jgi:hypothetical protein
LKATDWVFPEEFLRELAAAQVQHTKKLAVELEQARGWQTQLGWDGESMQRAFSIPCGILSGVLERRVGDSAELAMPSASHVNEGAAPHAFFVSCSGAAESPDRWLPRECMKVSFSILSTRDLVW